MDYSMEVSALGDRISIGEEAHVITLGVSTGFPAVPRRVWHTRFRRCRPVCSVRRCARLRTLRRGIRACRPTRR